MSIQELEKQKIKDSLIIDIENNLNFVETNHNNIF